MNRCRSCGAAIRWVLLPGGKRMPVDAAPAVDGSVLLGANDTASVLAVADRARCTAPLYKSHFATCPQAAQHRRRS